MVATKRATSTNRKPKAKAKATAAPSTLLEQEEAETPTQWRRTCPRRDIDGMVDKLLKDNFRGWTAQQADCSYINGVSLRAQLLKDKALQLKGELRMGKNYAGMRTRYEDMASPAMLLKVKHPGEPINDRLRSSLVELCSARCNIQPLLAWLQEDVADTQRSVVALFKATLDLKPDSRAKQCSAIVEVMRYIMRNGVQNRFREETALLTKHFDQTLSRSYTSMKKNEVPGGPRTSRLPHWWSRLMISRPA